MREFLSLRQGYMVGVVDIAIAVFEKCSLPQGETSHWGTKDTYLGIWEDKEAYLRELCGSGYSWGEPAFNQCTEVEKTLVGEAKVLESSLMIEWGLGKLKGGRD